MYKRQLSIRTILVLFSIRAGVCICGRLEPRETTWPDHDNLSCLCGYKLTTVWPTNQNLPFSWSPWYNGFTGWLGVNHQFTYLLLVFYCLLRLPGNIPQFGCMHGVIKHCVRFYWIVYLKLKRIKTRTGCSLCVPYIATGVLQSSFKMFLGTGN